MHNLRASKYKGLKGAHYLGEKQSYYCAEPCEWGKGGDKVREVIWRPVG